MTENNNTANTIHMTGVQGTVKWFSNRKGFGFITSPDALSEEIFVHQTGIVTDGQFRTLEDESQVKFDVEKEADSGRLKAVNVTNVDGTPIVPPPRQPRRPRGPREGSNQQREGDENDDYGDGANDDADDEGMENGEGGGGNNNRNNSKSGRPRGGGGGGNRRNGRRSNNRNDGDAAAAEGESNSNNRAEGTSEQRTDKTPREPPFHTKFSDELRSQIEAKGIVLGNRTTIDVALAPHARIKLGQGGYAGISLQTAVVGEGTYVCDTQGMVTFTWARALKCTSSGDGTEGSAWKPHDATQLLPSFSLLDENVGPVQPNETAATLWGADKPDPRDAFEANGFQMRRVVLTRPPNSHSHRFRRSGGGRGGGGNRRSNYSTSTADNQ